MNVHVTKMHIDKSYRSFYVPSKRFRSNQRDEIIEIQQDEMTGPVIMDEVEKEVARDTIYAYEDLDDPVVRVYLVYQEYLDRALHDKLPNAMKVSNVYNLDLSWF